MKTKTIDQIYGNFNLRVEATYDEAHRETLEGLGILQVMQRVPASTADKALDGKNWLPGKKAGTLLKPDKWSRTGNIPYSPEAAQKLKDGAMGERVEIAEGVFINFRVVGVTEHESGTASPMKRAAAFVDSLLAFPETAEKMRGMFKTMGLADAETAERDALVEFAHNMGLGADPKKV